MPTECSAELFEFARIEGRSVVAGFDGGKITSDAGALLLGASERAIGLIDRLAGCFTDSRSPEQVEDKVATLVGQRVFGIALGYEDVLDHDESISIRAAFQRRGREWKLACYRRAGSDHRSLGCASDSDDRFAASALSSDCRAAAGNLGNGLFSADRGRLHVRRDRSHSAHFRVPGAPGLCLEHWSVQHHPRDGARLLRIRADCSRYNTTAYPVGGYSRWLYCPVALWVPDSHCSL